jgi:hypothetical protein
MTRELGTRRAAGSGATGSGQLGPRGSRGAFLADPLWFSCSHGWIEKKPFDRRVFTRLLAALALTACASDTAPPSVAAASPARLRSYQYVGVAGSSEVTQEHGAAGRESLRGTTDLGMRGNAAHTLANESATLDPLGRLERAEVVVSRPGMGDARYTLDATLGTVRVERTGSTPLDWHVPVDAPWLYAPASGGAADVVRVVEPEHQRSYLTTVDQVAVQTERGTTLAIGDDGVDADDDFITELRLFHGAVTMARVAAIDLGA